MRIIALSARPIREAYLRRLSFPTDLGCNPDFQKTIPIEAATASRQEEEVACLRQFADANPKDIRIQGDPDNIVIALAISHYEPPRTAIPYAEKDTGQRDSEKPIRRPWIENTSPDVLMDLTISDFTENTFLSTETGRRSIIARYDPPGTDRLGAKFYFPRILSDGIPLIRSGDKELRFETLVRGQRIRVRFDLKKMIYNNRLEIMRRTFQSLFPRTAQFLDFLNCTLHRQAGDGLNPRQMHPAAP